MDSIQKSRGFTLLELLIVIGILSLLLSTTILALNPAQMFAQARDTQRISDINTLRSAISFHLTTAESPNLGDGTGFTCGTNFGATNSGVSSPFAAPDVAHAGVRTLDGEGWVAINFSLGSLGSQLATLPLDPNNDSSRFYAYSCDNTNKTFELNANLESQKFRNGGTADLESTDGGNDDDLYEVGNDPDLDL